MVIAIVRFHCLATGTFNDAEGVGAVGASGGIAPL
jgi:hypothetical protein